MIAHLIGVVPIFMSAGAAAMPTILAAIASVAALLLKPRELVHLVRQKSGAIVLCILAAVLGGTVWMIRSKPITRADVPVAAHFDWAKVAQDLIAMQVAGRTPTALAGEIVVDQPAANGHDPPQSSLGGSSPISLKPFWSYRPDDTMFLAKPLAVDGRIYVAGCQADLGTYTGLLACLDAETGKPIWQVSQLASDDLKPFFSSPALSSDGKYLLIGQGLHDDHDCSLLCFETETGKLHWAVKTTLHIESSPAIFGDLAVVGAGAIEGRDGRATGDPGFVLAVRISDGKELWRLRVNDPESSPTIDPAGTVYVGSGFNGSAVVAIRDGHELWHTAVNDPMTGPILLADNRVIAGGGNGDVVHSADSAQGQVVSLDRKTGAIQWNTTLTDSVLGGIVAGNDMLFCPARTGEVIALSISDGRVIWRTRISGNAPVLAGCAIAGDQVYAISNDGYLAVMESNTGHLLEKVYLNDQSKPGTGLTVSTPQIVGNRIYVGSETGGVRCFVGTGAK